MNRVFTAFFTCALLVIAPGVTMGQGFAGKFAFSAEFGWGMPVSDFKYAGKYTGKYFALGEGKSDFAVGVSGEYYISGNLAVGAKFAYHRFKTDPFYDVTKQDGHYAITEFGGFTKLIVTSPGSPVHLYGKTGIYIAKLKEKFEFSDHWVYVDDFPCNVIERPIYFEHAEGEINVNWTIGYEVAVGIIPMFSDKIGLFGEVGFNQLITYGIGIECKVSGRGISRAGDGEATDNTAWIGAKAGIIIFFGG